MALSVPEVRGRGACSLPNHQVKVEDYAGESRNHLCPLVCSHCFSAQLSSKGITLVACVPCPSCVVESPALIVGCVISTSYLVFRSSGDIRVPIRRLGWRTADTGKRCGTQSQVGRGQAVKARDFESRIRRFESFRPSQFPGSGCFTWLEIGAPLKSD